MEREHYKSVEPLSEAQILDSLAENQRELDAVEADIDELKGKVKACNEKRDRVVATIGVALHARQNKQALYELSDGKLTIEKPEEPGLFPPETTGKPTIVETPKDAAEKAETPPLTGIGDGSTVTAETFQALDTYRNGKRSQAERKAAAGVLLGALAGGANFPEGLDKTEIRKACKRILAERDEATPTVTPPAAAGTVAVDPTGARVLAECAKTVNLIPVDSVEAFEEGQMALVAETGEVLEVLAIKPRRKELGVRRGVNGELKVIPVGARLRRASVTAGKPTGPVTVTREVLGKPIEESFLPVEAPADGLSL